MNTDSFDTKIMKTYKFDPVRIYQVDLTPYHSGLLGIDVKFSNATNLNITVLGSNENKRRFQELHDACQSGEIELVKFIITQFMPKLD